MNLCEYIAEELSRRGVKFVFGIPGGPSIPYMEEFRKRGIRFILTSNETSAGIMADVTGRLGRIPGVCHSTFGPGATNLATGVGGALLDRSPMIALTTEVPLNMSRRTVQMNIDHHSLFEPLTKATIRMNPESAGEILADAFDLAVSEYPGPVHIGLPSDIAEQRLTSLESADSTGEWDSETVLDGEVSMLLEYAKKPVLAVGLTATRFDIRSELERFLSEFPMPLVVTPMAKGIISEDHPCYAGVLFHALSDRLTSLIEEADLVIAYGYDPVEYNYESWLPDVPLIHINTIKTDMPCDIMVKQLTGNLEGILDMVAAVANHQLNWPETRIKDVRESILGVKQNISDKLGPLELLVELENIMQTDSILSLDVGSHIHLFGQLWETGKSAKLLMTNGWSGMGFAIPAAIAAKLNYPDKELVALVGDGGFLMSAGELIVARREGLKIIFIVLSDRELNLIKLKQQKKNLDPLNISLYEGELFDADKFLGIKILNTDTRTGFRSVLEEALNSDEAVIINASIDPSAYHDYVIV